MKNIKISFSFLLLLLLTACQHQKHNTISAYTPVEIDFDVQFEKFTLANGLTVILHEDHSDPIVAVATIVHVGSNREKPGRTGFAHFFEHMAFNNSENVPMGANRKMIPELGGSRNGGTWSDGTMYYEVVPKDAFEKLMWIDSDRFGYMINTVTQGTLEREKQVVKNEKRQRVDNRAYGHTSHVIKKALYPKDHPYNWTVIGDLQDLQSASLEDVREFYHKYYTPANATLVIAGDIDSVDTKRMVELWFGEIKAGEPIPDMEIMPVSLEKNIKLFHLDNFAKLPEIRITFPTVEQYHKDAYALDVLAYILSEGNKSPLYETLVVKEKLSPSVSAYQSSSELAGTFTVRVLGNDGVDLDDIHSAIKKALLRFERYGIRDEGLMKIKASQETGFYNEISSVLNKAFQLGIYNEYAGDPAFIKHDIENILAVTKDDVNRVYTKYIKNKAAIITSFVPKDQAKLAVKGSKQAQVVEEQIVQDEEQKFTEDLNPEFVKTISKHDRSEPPLSDLPAFKTPEIWRTKSAKGIPVIGIEQHELPLVNFSLRIEGGQLLDQRDKLGTAQLLSAMMNEGTKLKSPVELQDAIGQLGSSLSVIATKTSITINGSSLKRNYLSTMELLTEMVLHPSFLRKGFKVAKSQQLTRIKSSYGNPNTVAGNIIMQKIYGDNHVAGLPLAGYESTVKNIKLKDVINWYKNNFSLKMSSFQVVGDINQEQVLESLTKLDSQWGAWDVELPKFESIISPSSPKIYFVDFPDAKQSVLYVGKAIIKGDHKDYNKLNVVNNRLGTGSSARLTQTLRIDKGYTYGAFSFVERAKHGGTFIAGSQVRSNVTLESLEIIKELISNYSASYEQNDLDVTKNLIIKGNTRKFEALPQLMNLAKTMKLFNLPDNYLGLAQQELESMTLEQSKTMIDTYLNEQQMIYVIVGDAKTQYERIKQLGYGEPVMLDRMGNRLQ